MFSGSPIAASMSCLRILYIKRWTDWWFSINLLKRNWHVLVRQIECHITSGFYLNVMSMSIIKYIRIFILRVGNHPTLSWIPPSSWTVWAAGQPIYFSKKAGKWNWIKRKQNKNLLLVGKFFNCVAQVTINTNRRIQRLQTHLLLVGRCEKQIVELQNHVCLFSITLYTLGYNRLSPRYFPTDVLRTMLHSSKQR